MGGKKMGRRKAIGLSRILPAVLFILGLYNGAWAFQIPTGNEDMELRWDNTLRYNYGVRTTGPEDAIIRNPNIDDGDRNFNKGTVTNRLDILSELDLRYKRDYGFRISGAAWYDQRYRDPLGNDSIATSNHLENGRQALGLSDATKRYFSGPDGELLDAFVFGKFDLGSVPVNIKLGRHTVYWGEGLLFGGALNGISYSQMPIDAAKGFAVPGTEAKELFRPLFNLSAQAQLTNEFTVAGQYFLEWEPYRFPEAGSYLNNADVLLNGGESLILAPGVFFRHGNDIQPSGRKDFGISTRWAPDWLGGAFGLYYRRFSDKLPQAHVDLGTGQYFFAYADNIDLYGLSVSKEILGVSVGLDLSYRRNMPLMSEAVIMLPGTPRPAEGETLGARGDTEHLVLNFLGLLGKTPVYDIANWGLEFTYSRWERVTQGLEVFLGRDGYNNLDRVSKDALGMALLFKPTWFQVFPGMDLSMPINYSIGLSGNSALLFGDNKNAGSGSAGFSLDVYKKYNFALQYIKFFGDFDTGPTGAVTFSRGAQATLRDRDMIAFTFKFTF